MIDSQDRLLVCDRTNKRIQVFDQEGKYITEWKVPDLPHGIALMPDDTMFISLPHKILAGNAKTGEIYGPLGLDTEVDAEGIAVDKQGNIYVSEVFTRSMKKFAPVR
jgi:sugar lactone lactonase YvrE